LVSRRSAPRISETETALCPQRRQGNRWKRGIVQLRRAQLGQNTMNPDDWREELLFQILGQSRVWIPNIVQLQQALEVIFFG